MNSFPHCFWLLIIFALFFLGWSLGQHGEFSKYSNFDEATKVPLIIYVPDFSTDNIRIVTPVELVDIFPTLVDLTQVGQNLQPCNKNKSNWKLCTEGKSLVPLMFSTPNKTVSTNSG